MDIQRINTFLCNIAANNNRIWFNENKKEYEACRADFEDGVTKMITALTEYDDSISHLTAKDCCYRFYRDLRFTQDKSPYKRHFGAYICPNGKKSLMAGYYIHVEPGHSFLSVGAYYLPMNILTSCRNEIMGNIDEWLECVENNSFVDAYGKACESLWERDDKGFGLSCLKKCPVGFPHDYEYVKYLRMKDYACWHNVPDDFYAGDGWVEKALQLFRTAQGMKDFVNNVIADYE